MFTRVMIKPHWSSPTLVSNHFSSKSGTPGQEIAVCVPGSGQLSVCSPKAGGAFGPGRFPLAAAERKDLQ